MTHGDTAGLLGVIAEVALSVHIGVVADDLDGVLVGANSTVGAQTVELAAHGAFGSRDDLLAQLQAGAGHVVVDAHGEVVLHFAGQVVIHSLDHGGVELLGAQAVTAAHDLDVRAAGFHQRGAHIGVQRLAQRAGLLGAVQNGDGLAGGGDSGHQVLHAEGTVEVNLDQAQLFTLLVEVVDGLFDGLAAGAHGDDDPLGIGSAHILEQLVLAAHQLGDLLHDLFHDFGHGVVVLVGGFTVLEVDVGVLGGALLMRMLRIQGALAEGLHLVPGNHGLDVLVVDGVDLLHFVAGTETVEEMQERHAALQRGQMSDQSQVHGFLNAVGGQHGETGLTAGHHVAVITENAQGMSGQSTGADMENARQQLAGDLVHVGDHQKQALAGGEGGGQRAGNKAAVHGARRARFGLHFAYMDGLAEKILRAFSRPLIHDLRHGRGRGDGVNGCHVAERIRNVANGGIAVNGHFGCH